MAKKKVKDEEEQIVDPVEIQLAKAQVLAIKEHKGKSLFLSPSDKNADPSVKRMEMPLLSLNKILSDKWGGEKSGFAMGRIYNFYGPESIGKSALAAQIGGEVLKRGGRLCWLDKEDSFDPHYFRDTFGIDWWKNKNLTLCKPDTAEAAFDTIQSFIDNNAADLIVLDSIAALGTASDMDGDASTNSMAAVARRLASHFQRITGKLGKSNISVIYINQLRANLSGGMAYGDKSTGGNPMKFYPHVTLRFRRKSLLIKGQGDTSEFIGTEVSIEGEKNKTSWPHIKRTVHLYPGEGFSKEADLLNLAEEVGTVQVGGSWYTFGENRYQGFDKIRLALKEHPELFNTLRHATLQELERPVDIATGEILPAEAA